MRDAREWKNWAGRAYPAFPTHHASRVLVALRKGTNRGQHLMCDLQRGRSVFTLHYGTRPCPDGLEERFELQLQRLVIIALELFDHNRRSLTLIR